MINGIISLDRLYDIFQMQEIRSWDKRKGRGDKENLINSLYECIFNTALGSRGGGKLLVACIVIQRGGFIV